MEEEKVFIVPVEWTLCGVAAVKAKSAEEACRKVQEDNDDIPVVTNRFGEYLDGSFVVPGLDEGEAIDRCEYYTKEHENGHRFYILNDL